MRPLRALVIYIAVIFVGGALLAPWLYGLVQESARVIPRAAGVPFHRVLDRSFYILALAGLWPLLRVLGTTSWREIGLVSPYGQSGKLLGGLLLGLLSLAAVAGTAAGFGAGSFVRPADAHRITTVILGAAGTAAAVAVLEEIFFRGGVFGGLRRVLHWPLALVISSAIFALTHFFKRADIAGPVSWNSGLVLLPQLFDFHAFVPKFFTLGLVGAMLAIAYQRTGNLYFSIGLHAGWVFTLRIYSQLFTPAPGAKTWFWGSGEMTDGWLAFLVLVVMLAGTRFLPRADKRPTYVIPP